MGSLPQSARRIFNGSRTSPEQQSAITDLETAVVVVVERWSAQHTDAVGINFRLHVNWQEPESTEPQLESFTDEIARDLEWQRVKMRDA